MRIPWYISASAVRDYLRIRRRPVVDDGPEWDRAERELIDLAIDAVRREQIGQSTPKKTRLDDEAKIYRATNSQGKLQFVVSEHRRSEGNLPQLVAVWPATGKGK